MMKKSYIILLFIIVVIIGGLFGASFNIYNNQINTDRIYDGIIIDGYDVGGMTKEEALKYLKENKQKDYNGRVINLSYGDKSYEIPLNDIGYSYDYESGIEEAYNIAREGNVLTRYKTIKEVKDNNEVVNLDYQYDKNLLQEQIDIIEEQFNQDSINATIEFTGSSFSITEGKDGFFLKDEELIELLDNNMDELGDVTIPIEIKKPSITKDLLSRINGVIGQFSTSFGGSSSGRIENIRLSAGKVSDVVILPGDQVSFNESMGSINSASGFKEAPVIVNGELEPGFGGGICQTSTTLYNALLLADVDIAERHPHSIPINYVPKGTDGAVASGYKDLKYKNDFDFPIYIRSSVSGSNMTFYIYGDTNVKDYTVKIEPELIETIPYRVQEISDSKVAPGTRELDQKGRNGYKVRTYKSIIKDGKVVDRFQITSDYYRGRDYIYKIGPELPVSNTVSPPSVAPEKQQEVYQEEPIVEDEIIEDVEVIELLP